MKSYQIEYSKRLGDETINRISLILYDESATIKSAVWWEIFTSDW